MFDNLIDFLNENATSTDAEPYNIEIDYKEIEDCYYRALKRVQLENDLKNSLSSSKSVSDSDVVSFASSTDSTLYTVSVDAAPTSSAQQNTALLLECRNVLLIFLLSWFAITIYSKLKNLMINYTTKE